LDLEPDMELARWRRRSLFLTSVFLHIFLILFIIYAPSLVRRGKLMMGIRVTPQPQVTTLFIPPDLLKSLRQPPPEARLSDKNRRAQGRSPTIDPNGLHMPYSRGNTPEPEIARGAPPPPPPAAAAPTPPPGGPPAQPAAPKSAEPQAEARLRLEDVTPPSAGGGRFHMPSLTPGQAIQQSVQGAARGGYHPEIGGGGGGGDSDMEFNNLHPNFSTEAPTILSDTRGVDFGPYLARVVYIVRRNWYAVIPESARLGEKGWFRAAIAPGGFLRFRPSRSRCGEQHSCLDSISSLAPGVHGRTPGAPVHLPVQPPGPVAVTANSDRVARTIPWLCTTRW